MILKLTILLWVLALVARYIVKITASREDKIAATLFGKARITPFRVLTVMLMFASLIMTVVTAIWFLFFCLK